LLRRVLTNFLPELALNNDLPNLHLPNRWDLDMTTMPDFFVEAGSHGLYWWWMGEVGLELWYSRVLLPM
jgi:hypothetical protein